MIVPPGEATCASLWDRRDKERACEVILNKTEMTKTTCASILENLKERPSFEGEVKGLTDNGKRRKGYIVGKPRRGLTMLKRK